MENTTLSSQSNISAQSTLNSPRPTSRSEAKIISFIAFLLYSLLSVYYIFFYFELFYINQEVRAKKPFPWFVSIPVILAALSFIYWLYLRSKERKGEVVKADFWLSIILLISPFAIYLLATIVARIQLYLLR